MKKKFNLLTLLIFLFIIPFQAQGSMSHKCFELFDKIKNSKDPKLSHYETLENSTFGFWFDMYVGKIDGEDKWIIKRDENNFPIIGRITSDEVANLIEFGDKVLSVDGKKLNLLNDDEIEDLTYFTEDNQAIESNIVFEKNKEKKTISSTLKIITDYQRDTELFFVVTNINNISQKDSTFKADIYLSVKNFYGYDTTDLPLGPLTFDTLVFKDANNEWDYSKCENIPEENIIEFNIPDISTDISFFNSINLNKNTQQKKINIYPNSQKIGDDTGDDGDYVTYLSEIYGTFEFQNSFNLNNFPFDKQTLKIKIADLGGITDQLIDFNSNSYKAIQYNLDKIKVTGWEIVSSKIINSIYQDAVGTNLSGIEFSLEIERKTDYYIYKVIIPILLILLVCWSVAWIDPKELESKLTITIVCLLSLIAYNFVIDSELPKLEYLTVMDWIILVSYVYATIPNFLSIYLFKLSKNKNISMIEKVTYFSKTLGPSSYFLIIFVIIIINANLSPNTTGQTISWMVK
jgi:hypothetical protein